MKMVPSAGIGSRKRYLAEQEAFLAQKWPEEFGKGLRATEFEPGNRHEAYSGEAKRRRLAASGLGWQATSTATGAAGTAALSAATLGHKPVQAGLDSLKQRYPAAASDLNGLQRIGRAAAKRPKTVLAASAGLGVTSALSRRVAGFRNDEESGVSQSIGRLKAGDQYRADQKRLVRKMSAFRAAGILGRIATDPTAQRVGRLAYTYRKPLGATGGAAVVTATADQARRRSKKRAAEIRGLREELGKAATGMSKDVLVFTGRGGTPMRSSSLRGSPTLRDKAADAQLLREDVKMRAKGARTTPFDIPTARHAYPEPVNTRRGEILAKGSGMVDPGSPVQRKWRYAGEEKGRLVRDAKGQAQRVELGPLEMGQDLNPRRLKVKLAEAKARRAAGRRVKAEMTPAQTKRFRRKARVGAAGRLTWGPDDAASNEAWRSRQGFGRTDRRRPSTGYLGSGRPYGVSKTQPLKTTLSEDDAKRVVQRYGATGTLPKDLPREQRMAAYEARYVASGGRKGEKWQRRANGAERVRTTGLAGATLAGGALLAGRTRLGREATRRIRSDFPRSAKVHSGHLGDAGLAAGVAGGAGELYAGRARRKRASYASAPGGVAASALRRMRAYDTRG